MKILVKQHQDWEPLNCPKCIMALRCVRFKLDNEPPGITPICPLSGAETAKEVTEGRLFVDYNTHQQLKVYVVPMPTEVKDAE